MPVIKVLITILTALLTHASNVIAVVLHALDQVTRIALHAMVTIFA